MASESDPIQVLSVDDDFTLYRAWLHGSTAPNLILEPRSAPPPRALLRRLENELAVAGQLSSQWAIRPIAIEEHNGRKVLKLENAEGYSLRTLVDSPVSMGEFLRVAVELAVALGQIHSSGLIHRDIRPANVILAPNGGVRFCGFGLATGIDPRDPGDSVAVSAALPYVAPELTGRMNRSVDIRSDLYSLGATLYELLTGSPPFTATDPMQVIHHHLARRPESPGNRVDGIPEVVSAIVIKLLSKNVSERYQTASSLETDLRRCRDSWERSGAAPTFEPGESDRARELLLQRQLVGREGEVAKLEGIAKGVEETGVPAFALIGGPSGVGKSSLVEELRRRAAFKGDFFVTGKFDQNRRDIPYAPIAEAFQGLIRDLIGRPERELAVWRDLVLSALGANGQLIAGLVPELALVIGQPPPAAPVQLQDASSRFHTVFRRFVGVFAREGRPLTIFLDDLQWLDAATIELVAHLLGHPETANVLVVGAYRDNEVNAEHPLAKAIEAIREAGLTPQQVRLSPLTVHQVEKLVSTSLRLPTESVHPLAELVFERTGGNPLFATQFLRELVAERLMEFDHVERRWTWDLEKSRVKTLGESVAALVVLRLSRLAPATLDALRHMSCFGNRVDEASLAAHLRLNDELLISTMRPAVQAGLIAHYDGQYRFLHDRIQEATYDRLSVAERQAIHLQIGRGLVNRLDDDQLHDRIFDIVGQFDQGIGLVRSHDEAAQIAHLNLLAAKRAKAATAFDAAAKYLSSGRLLFSDDVWTRDYQLAFELELTLAECEFLTGDLAAAESRLEMLATQTNNDVDLASVTRVAVELFHKKGDIPRAMQIAVGYLKRVDAGWPRDVTPDAADREYVQVLRRLEALGSDHLAGLPVMSDPTHCATMEVYTGLSALTLFTGDTLRKIVVCRMVSLCLKHGNNDSAPLAYLLFASLQGMSYDDYAGGSRLAQVGLSLAEDPRFRRHLARAYLAYAVHVTNWTRPLEVGREYLQRAFAAAMESADSSTAAFSCIDLVTNLLASGTPLADVERQALAMREAITNLMFPVIRTGVSEQLAALRMLRGTVDANLPFSQIVGEIDGPGGRESLAPEGYGGREVLRFARAIGSVRELFGLTLMGEFSRALAAVAQDPPLWTVPTQFERAEYQFYAALSHAVLCGQTSGQEQKRHRQALRVHHAQISVWASHGANTFTTRMTLLDAELARLDGRDDDAGEFYEQAILSAHQHGFIQNEALACERAASFYEAKGRRIVAGAYARRAYECYETWGAEAKLRQLESMYKDLAPAPPTEAHAHVVLGRLDLAAVVEMYHSLSGEIVLARLVESLMRKVLEQSGAVRAALVLLEGDNVHYAAQASADDGGIVKRQEPSLDADRGIARSVMNRVIRSRKHLLIDDVSTERARWLNGSATASDQGSVLCLPLLRQGTLVGLLYLENDLSTHVFTEDRVDMLQLIASQAAISIENAQLFQDLQDSETKTRQVMENLKRASSEKDALLKEVHHRVKNNLQLVSSMLSLQAGATSDPTTADLLMDSRNRVRSMALVHENLYHAGSFVGVAMSEHLRSLCAHLGRIYALEPRIAIETKIENVQLDLDRAIAVGLIVNELVSNAFKHAFPADRHGQISVTASCQPGGGYTVEVSDDGIGLPEGIRLENSSSIGLLLVQDLASQIHGHLQVVRGRGTRFILTFE